MINFKAKDELGTTVAAVIGILGLVAVLVYVLVVPEPPDRLSRSGHVKEQQEIVQQVSDSRKQLASAQASVEKHTWTSLPQEIQAASLDKVSSLARANGVKLLGFRPQRTGTAGELETIPFVLTAEGAFPDVMSFIAAVENPDNKLAANLVQLSSAEGDSDKVTATVGVMAFRQEKQDNG